MGKVNTLRDKAFLKKIFFSLCILLFLIFLADLTLISSGLKSEQSFSKAISIVTNVEVVNENIQNKYFYAVLSLLGGVVQFYFIYIILEYIVEGKFQNIFLGVKHMNKVKSMKDHYIVAGGGRVGSHAAKILKEYGKEVVIIDKNEEIVQKLRKDNFIVIKGDVLDETFLKEINIEKAKYLIASLGSDSDNILLILTAREINPGLKISARANKESVIQKLQHAGASHVVVPASLGGEELAKTATRTT